MTLSKRTRTFNKIVAGSLMVGGSILVIQTSSNDAAIAQQCYRDTAYNGTEGSLGELEAANGDWLCVETDPDATLIMTQDHGVPDPELPMPAGPLSIPHERTDPTKTLIIGDSLCVGTETYIANQAASESFMNYSTDCESGRSINFANTRTGIDVLNDLVVQENNDLFTYPGRIVFELGTNGINSTAEIDTILDIADDFAVEIGWVTFHVQSPATYGADLDQYVTYIQGLASADERITVCDWETTLKANAGSYFSADGVHYTTTGSDAFGDALIDCAKEIGTLETPWVGPITPIASAAGALDGHIGPMANTVTASSAADPTGNFRFNCAGANFQYNDSVVLHGMAMASHLHMLWSNPNVDHNTTYETLRGNAEGGTCYGGPANGSAYWYPALLDDDGNVVFVLIPIGFNMYYKVDGGGFGYATEADKQLARDYISNVQELPAGLRMVAGHGKLIDAAKWKCASHPGVYESSPGVWESAKVSRLDQIDYATRCQVGSVFQATPQRILIAEIVFPECGANDANGNPLLNSPDNFEHMSYKVFIPRNDGSGKSDYKCPATHPVLYPQITQFAFFDITNETQAEVNSWSLSSDAENGTSFGDSLHGDFFNGWDPGVSSTWTNNCLALLLNCEIGSSAAGPLAGDLGNGTGLLPSDDGYGDISGPVLVNVERVPIAQIETYGQS